MNWLARHTLVHQRVDLDRTVYFAPGGASNFVGQTAARMTAFLEEEFVNKGPAK
jgi:hypothetical protein